MASCSTHVDVLAAAVVAPAGVALGVLVGRHGALGLQDRLRDEVLGRDHLERPLLAVQLLLQRVGDLRIDVVERALEVVGGQVGHGTGHASTGSGARRRLERRGDGLARHGALAHDRPRAGGLVVAQVDDRRRRRRAARPPSSSRATPARMPAGTSSRRRASGPPAWLAEDCRTATRAPSSGVPAGTRTPSTSPPPAQREPVLRVGEQERHAAREQRRGRRARARTEPGERRQRHAGVEEHDRGGLVGRAALERVQARHRSCVLGVAGQPVDRVGREERDAAARGCSPRRRLTTGRPPPGRCPRGPPRPRPRRRPPARASSRTAGACPIPTSTARKAAPAARAAGTSRRSTVSPSAPAYSATAGSKPATSTGSRAPSST